MTHSELVELGRKWLSRQCAVVVTELTAANPESPDVIGWSAGCSTLIECKVTRSDFLADAKKMFRLFPEQGMGDHRLYLTPKGLLSVDELPLGWGLLEATGRGVRTIVFPKREYDRPCFLGNKNNELTLLISAMRRLKVQPDCAATVRTYFHSTSKRGAISLELEEE